MSSSPSNDALLDELDRVVNDTLSYFDSAGRSTNARVDRWHARDVLMHFLYFHDATACGAHCSARLFQEEVDVVRCDQVGRGPAIQIVLGHALLG